MMVWKGHTGMRGQLLVFNKQPYLGLCPREETLFGAISWSVKSEAGFYPLLSINNKNAKSIYNWEK